MSQSWIRTENLTYSYQDDSTGEDQPVLHGIDLTIDCGEYIAIIGHNGSGKSTLAKLLNLVLEPTDGAIYVDGKNVSSPDMTDEDVFALRQKVGMVFQNPDNQLVATVVEEDVAFGPENLGVPSAEIRQRVDDALAMVGMTEYAKHEPHRLSGGQKQRVAIAGIIAMMPECMIFDESTAMLDPLGRREVLDTMEMLHREKNITIITITHHMDEAARADRIIVLDDGRILRDGTPEEIFSDPEPLIAAGLDVPQSAALIHRLRKQGIELPGKIGTPDDCLETICALFEQ
ncbi:MAG: energy-coupling factor transporter ATPase [Ruminococcaceae bacterium]|nr:energy-coupling factor transporter ATPase [Oscillospiraceae bacterium]